MNFDCESGQNCSDAKLIIIWLYGYSYIRMIIQYFPRAEVDIMLSLAQILGLAYSLQGKNFAVKYLSFYPSTRVGSNEANLWFTS